MPYRDDDRTVTKVYHFFESFNPSFPAFFISFGLFILAMAIIGLSGYGIVSCERNERAEKLADRLIDKSAVKGCFVESYPVDPTNSLYGVKYRIVMVRNKSQDTHVAGFYWFEDARVAMDKIEECKKTK